MEVVPYFRLIAGFVGLAIIAGGSVFLFQHVWQGRSPSPAGPNLTTLAIFAFNTAVFCVVAWKVLQGYKRRHHMGS